MKEDVIFKIAFHNSMGQSCKLHLEMEVEILQEMYEACDSNILTFIIDDSHGL